MKNNCSVAGQRGFTLIESLMAISILAIVAVQILNVQSSSIAVTQSARDNMRATWLLRSAISQLEYANETLGVKSIPKDGRFQWALDPNFSATITVEQTPLEASRLLFTAMKLGNASAETVTGGGAENEADPAGGQKELGQMLDSQIPKDLYYKAKIVVSWQEGESNKSLEGGMLLIDSSQLDFAGKIQQSIPGGLLDNSGGGAGDLGGGTGGNAPSGDKNAPPPSSAVNPGGGALPGDGAL